MFLTRLGFNSKMVITGDITQVDLPASRPSGLIEIQTVLRGIDGIEFIYFDHRDVVATTSCRPSCAPTTAPSRASPRSLPGGVRRRPPPDREGGGPASRPEPRVKRDEPPLLLCTWRGRTDVRADADGGRRGQSPAPRACLAGASQAHG